MTLDIGHTLPGLGSQDYISVLTVQPSISETSWTGGEGFLFYIFCMKVKVFDIFCLKVFDIFCMKVNVSDIFCIKVKVFDIFYMKVKVFEIFCMNL